MHQGIGKNTSKMKSCQTAQMSSYGIGLLLQLLFIHVTTSVPIIECLMKLQKLIKG